MHKGTRSLALLVALGVLALSTAVAIGQAPSNPLNDLLALGQGFGETPAKVDVQQPAEPPFEATPLVKCGPGSHPQPGIDGRVPAGSAANGLNCNATAIAHQGTEGGFKVLRYIDNAGHECAFYDTTLLFPLNALNPGAGSSGVAVLDMSDPAHPVQTDTLRELPMLSPHESLTLNQKRGLLAAVNGNPATYPGDVAIYSVQNDCRHPVLQSTGLYARFGHESGFSLDGRTFYATSTATPSITAIDVTDPQHPHPIWEGNILAHGMSLSDDGNRAYIADPTGGDMLILDTSQIQARKAEPDDARDQPDHLAQRLDPAERDPVHRGRQAVRARVRRVHRVDAEAGRRRRCRRRRPHHRHLRRDAPEGRRRPAPAGQPARGPQGGIRRSGCVEPGPGLRRALLQHPDARRPEDRRLLVHRVRPARVRHQRPDPPEGDRLLRRAAAGALGERLLGERLRDVAAGVRRRPPRGLVHRRHERLLRRAHRRLGVAEVGRGHGLHRPHALRAIRASTRASGRTSASR